VKSFGRFSATRRFDDTRLIRSFGRLFGANLSLRLRPVRQASTLWPSVLLPQRISPFANSLFSLFRHSPTQLSLRHVQVAGLPFVSGWGWGLPIALQYAAFHKGIAPRSFSSQIPRHANRWCFLCPKPTTITRTMSGMSGRACASGPTEMAEDGAAGGVRLPLSPQHRDQQQSDQHNEREHHHNC
jgi:hypothetical protein